MEGLLFVRFDQQKESLRGEQLLQMIESRLNFVRPMQNIACDDDIKLPSSKILIEGITVDVEPQTTNERVGGEYGVQRACQHDQAGPLGGARMMLLPRERREPCRHHGRWSDVPPALLPRNRQNHRQIDDVAGDQHGERRRPGRGRYINQRQLGGEEHDGCADRCGCG